MPSEYDSFPGTPRGRERRASWEDEDAARDDPFGGQPGPLWPPIPGSPAIPATQGTRSHLPPIEPVPEWFQPTIEGSDVGGEQGPPQQGGTQSTSTRPWATLSAMMERAPRTGRGEANGKKAGADELGFWGGNFLETCKTEYDRIGRELEELRLLIKQSGKELEKLSQRKTLAASAVREMEEHIEMHARMDIRATYLAASEAEMRAFMIGEQRDQMRTKEQTYERYRAFLEHAIEALSRPEQAAQAAARSAAWEQEQQAQAQQAVAQAQIAPAEPLFMGVGQTQGSGSLTRENAEIEALTRVISAQEEVRRRVAQRLHDGPTQSLANAVLTAEIFEKLVQSDPRRAMSELSNLKGVVTATLQETRKFIFELLPMTLDDLGLSATLRRYASDVMTKYSVQMPLALAQEDRRVPRDTAVAVFRVAQEAISNAVEHSRATQVRLTLALPFEGLVLAVEDNGVGFDVEEAIGRARAHQTQGIINMQERAEILGGWLRIESTRGRGSRIELSVPL